MSRHIPVFAAVLILGSLGSSIAAGARTQHATMPPGMTHEEHLAQMQKDAELKRRGAAAMGFDQNKTSHHFRLDAAGGTIEVSANDPSDEATRAEIRAHLKDIAAEFASGSFAKPLATHGEVPPGARILEQRKTAIAYRYEETPAGGRVRMTTTDPAARRGVYEFLRYQIREHATGDPLTVAK